MKQFISFIIKEGRHILRDKRTMLILFGMPVVLMLLFGFAITTDVKNVRTIVITSSADHQTKLAINRLAASEYFTITATVGTPKEAEQLIRNQKADMAIVFGQDFASKKSGLQLIVDGADPNMAQQWVNYATGVLTNMTGALVNTKMLYNPQMKSAYNFVPAIMGMLLMLVCAMMTSISIVREKERGTMEVLLVSPVRPLVIIIAKVVPYLVLWSNVVEVTGNVNVLLQDATAIIQTQKGNVGEIMDNVREASIGLRAFTDEIRANPAALLRSSSPEQLDETR